MKALIRNKKEIVTETDGIEGIDWKTGAPLTNQAWHGGPYTLMQNYDSSENDEPVQHEEVVEPEQVEIVDKNDYVIIEGKKYSKTELRSLLE